MFRKFAYYSDRVQKWSNLKTVPLAFLMVAFFIMATRTDAARSKKMTPQIQVLMALDCVIGDTIGTQVLAANTLRWWRRLQAVSTGYQIRFWGWNKPIVVWTVGCHVVVPQGTHHPSPLKPAACGQRGVAL